jgi:hypothetical protein
VAATSAVGTVVTSTVAMARLRTRVFDTRDQFRTRSTRRTALVPVPAAIATCQVARRGGWPTAAKNPTSVSA